ncbi:MAG: DNA mismatch repair protein MutS [Victivallaceae bacterium]|nr:DNA mismatch repair protein MutS [Victivallaceae bacterium]
MSDIQLTPMMKQYRQSKNEIPQDAILLFRMGDFYEMFFEDAGRASRLLNITLTKRAGVPMAGFPYHALEKHLPALLKAGAKVAVAEQVEDPKLAQGLVKRRIIRIITPGTVIDGAALLPDKNNFLVAVVPNKNKFGLASLDISTGEFKVTELDSVHKIETELTRLGTKECVIPQNEYEKWEKNGSFPVAARNFIWTPLEDWIFAYDFAEELLKRQFKAGTLDGFGCRGLRAAVCAAGAVLHYAIENLCQDADHVKKLFVYNDRAYLELDSISQRNLELVETIFGGDKANTLLGILDRTSTAMGGRLLRDWILRPLYERDRITARLDAVEALRDDPLTLAELRETIASIRDLERIIARLNIGTANARDLLALATGLELVPPVRTLLHNFDAVLLAELRGRLHELPELTGRIFSAVAEEPPQTLTDGDIIRSGFSAELDELRRASTEGKNWLSNIQKKEQERSGIKNLKVRFNKVFGYYIEISKSNLELVPEDYIRKQTLVNAERFITPELKELESKILGAEDKAKALEYQLFQELRAFTLEFTSRVQECAAALANIDVIGALAECARMYSYVRPHISEDETLIIKGGRHPVLDAVMQGERFVPNDTLLDGDENRMMIITGPNMAGKSTYIRQAALLVLMAQMGSFIPADSAVIGLVDRIFTRVGAADDISRGQSTFMVEMVETANILNHATAKSLVILDEIGRGTSTFDGLSIAWAIAEFLHDTPGSQARTLFATHYHELTEMALTRRGVKNYNIAVREYGDKIIFLRQIVPGGTDKSYGIHVAKLAGLPDSIITRASEILENLENSAMSKDGDVILAMHHNPGDPVRYSAEFDGDDDFFGVTEMKKKQAAEKNPPPQPVRPGPPAGENPPSSAANFQPMLF